MIVFFDVERSDWYIYMTRLSLLFGIIYSRPWEDTITYRVFYHRY